MSSNTEYMRTYMKTRYHDRREEAIAILGGSCKVCGNTDNLEVDHIDRSTKTMSFDEMRSVSRERFLGELKLCQLLCKAHHEAKTAAENAVGHGEGKTGKKNCFCELCKPLKYEANKEYKRRYRDKLRKQKIDAR